MFVKVSSIQSAEKESSVLETSNRLRNILHSAIIMPSTAHKSTFLQMYTTPVTALPPIFIQFVFKWKPAKNLHKFSGKIYKLSQNKRYCFKCY